jgi:hypothetical protein
MTDFVPVARDLRGTLQKPENSLSKRKAGALASGRTLKFTIHEAEGG